MDPVAELQERRGRMFGLWYFWRSERDWSESRFGRL